MDTSYRDRRRHPRIPLGVPVRFYLAGQQRPATIELVDVSAGGGAFRGPAAAPRLGQRAAFGFVMPGRAVCVARGHVVRVFGNEFALELDRMNDPFRGFLADISGPIVMAM
jgi:PilZ domain